jgi:hypothetical protein
MLECHNELVVVSSGDRRCGKRMALIQFCLPAKGEREEIIKFIQTARKCVSLDGSIDKRQEIELRLL